ncbi:hypothetical protein J8L88_14645 [Aquimarina sp. MMG015]|uniref:hypothetical protein n=1 Tax=Aquimarina sp. MMG015 TaxID=2822689 RepID=UPI001B3A3DF3|nr:hypothetical protein [Aquimarina sp. MMG015]MBQ4804098.1 hypothetical protein [Aquimarina sp. MMG015]
MNTNFGIMKKSLIFLFILLWSIRGVGQTTNFDNLNANYSVNKAITWDTSSWGSGFGHRILNTDPGGQTLLNFQGRHNATSWVDILTLTSNGKVGIGKSNPSRKLDVNGSIAGQEFINVQKGGSSLVSLNGQEHGYITGRNSSFENKFLIASNGNTYFNGGNVGIGTSNPTKLLDVSGDAIIGKLDSRHYLKISSSQWPEIRFQTPTSNERIRIGVAHVDYSGYNLSEGDFYVYSQTINQMPFIVKKDGDVALSVDTGNVGIGTYTPDAKLAVNGNIHTKEVKVDLTGWPDYVFEDSYELPTLQQVEDHITTKGHLINIPSASQVAENGILLGEMNAKLLEKIEELTLYTIAQEKKLKEQKEKNLELEERVKKIELLLKENNQK